MYAMSLLLMLGCTADLHTDGGDAGQRVPIGVSASVAEGGGTRAATDLQVSQFDVGETFYVFFDGGSTTVPHALYTTTGLNGSTSLSEVVGNEQPYFTVAATVTTLHAYYPQTVTETASSFTVLADQMADGDYKQSDLMYATAPNVEKSGSSVTVPLQFTHKLVKLTIIVKVDNDISNITNVSLVGGYRTIDITDGTTCTLGTTLSDAITDNAPVLLYQDAAGTSTLSCAAVLPPQAIAGAFIKVTTATDGAVTYSTSKTLASGHNYTIVLNVSKANLTRTFAAVGEWTSPAEAYTDPDTKVHFQ